MSSALDIAHEAVRAAQADAAEAVVQRERSGLVRFAASRVHQPTLIENESVQLRVVRGGRVGSSSTNRTDTVGLRAAAHRAEEAAESAPADPGFPGLPPPDEPPAVESFDPATASLTPEAQADLAAAAIEGAAGVELFGFVTSAETELAIASTTGLAVTQSTTDAAVLALAASSDESGYAAACAWRMGDLDPAAVAGRAAETARRTGDAVTVEPGALRAVLAPEAVAELLGVFAYTSLTGLALLEERSYLAGRIGERVFHESLTLVDDGRDTAGLPKAFDFEGVPKQPVTLVEDGVARDVVWDRRTALQAGDGRASTGHGLPGPAQSYGPMPMNLAIRPGNASADDLAGAVGEGIFVTRLHYLSIVDEREGLITGMTRDGTFRIRDGRLAEPLVNLRFTTSFPQLLHDLLGIGDVATRVSTSDFYGDRYATASVVPALATASFRVTGLGSSPGL